ncbi:uncharacterized protein LOC143892396 [Tasmannia lanceolata]|uniref:uncharacterized protein LOC143892396 n=1 Tax=Tasmannia lanceolata TaxID=3420 RepID=UPI004062C670
MTKTGNKWVEETGIPPGRVIIHSNQPTEEVIKGDLDLELDKWLEETWQGIKFRLSGTKYRKRLVEMMDELQGQGCFAPSDKDIEIKGKLLPEGMDPCSSGVRARYPKYLEAVPQKPDFRTVRLKADSTEADERVVRETLWRHYVTLTQMVMEANAKTSIDELNALNEQVTGLWKLGFIADHLFALLMRVHEWKKSGVDQLKEQYREAFTVWSKVEGEVFERRRKRKRCEEKTGELEEEETQLQWKLDQCKARLEEEKARLPRLDRELAEIEEQIQPLRETEDNIKCKFKEAKSDWGHLASIL